MSGLRVLIVLGTVPDLFEMFNSIIGTYMCRHSPAFVFGWVKVAEWSKLASSARPVAQIHQKSQSPRTLVM